jgi:methylated-DNA-[protein]-cysteine S-methyltransferase
MNTLYERTLSTPFGTMRLVADNHALHALDLPGLVSRFTAKPAVGLHPVLDQAEEEVERYFAGEHVHFRTPLCPQGTTFQRAVWAAVATITYGARTHYAAVARALGRPTAVRAVGHANGRNPLPLFVPCHRVVGRDGSLTGYVGGLAMKEALLTMERAHAQVVEPRGAHAASHRA